MFMRPGDPFTGWASAAALNGTCEWLPRKLERTGLNPAGTCVASVAFLLVRKWCQTCGMLAWSKAVLRTRYLCKYMVVV